MPTSLWPLHVAVISLRSLSVDPSEGPALGQVWLPLLVLEPIREVYRYVVVSSAFFRQSLSRVRGSSSTALSSLRNTWPGLETFGRLPCISELHNCPEFGDAHKGLIQG